MTRSLTIVFLSLTILPCSCSIVRLNSRKGLDIYLDTNTFDKLNGNYKNTLNDSLNYRRTVYSNFNYDSLFLQKDLIVSIRAIDKNKIALKLLDKASLIDSLTLKGTYRRGYFKTKREWNADFIAGPLLWIIGDNFKYLGLTKENKLVVINSGSAGVMLLVLFPIFSAGSGQFENEYERVN